jgi:hypothetical protein
MKSRAAFLTLMLLATAKPLLAGPPFQTDDPEPVDFRHYEFYTFGAVDGTPIELDPTGPAVEFNWGAVPNLQLHAILPLGASVPSDGSSHFGFTDTELGVKYRFVQESKYRPMIGTFTMFEIPTGDSSKGLGVGTVWYQIPIWMQKSWGHWTSYGGGGYNIVPQTGYNDFPFGGWLVQRDIGKKWTLGAEVYSHGDEGIATPENRASTMVDAGGYYFFRNPGFQLLFAYGHSIAGQTENYAYVGLYWTWGSQKGHGLNGLFAHHFPH